MPINTIPLPIQLFCIDTTVTQAGDFTKPVWTTGIVECADNLGWNFRLPVAAFPGLAGQ
jgi:hypothetical protein